MGRDIYFLEPAGEQGVKRRIRTYPVTIIIAQIRGLRWVILIIIRTLALFSSGMHNILDDQKFFDQIEKRERVSYI
jgi:hypothetical protein